MKTTKKKTAVRKKITKAPKTVEAYGNTWEDVSPGTKKDVEAAEKELGVKFPKELAELLMTCGGGEPENNFFEGPEDEVYELTIGYVFPLKDQPERPGIVYACKRAREKQGLPKSLIPFAYDDGDANLICLDLKSKRVVYWLHDSEDEPGLISKSFKRFVNGLEECPF